MPQFHSGVVRPGAHKVRGVMLGNRQVSVQLVTQQAFGKLACPLVNVRVIGPAVINAIERLIDTQLDFQTIRCFRKRNRLTIVQQRITGLIPTEGVLPQQVFKARHRQRRVQRMQFGDQSRRSAGKRWIHPRQELAGRVAAGHRVRALMPLQHRQGLKQQRPFDLGQLGDLFTQRGNLPGFADRRIDVTPQLRTLRQLIDNQRKQLLDAGGTLRHILFGHVAAGVQPFNVNAVGLNARSWIGPIRFDPHTLTVEHIEYGIGRPVR